MKKRELFFDKPIYVGMCILDFSKLFMYNIHNNVMKKIDPLAKLCYMDTDGYIYLFSIDPYKIIEEHPEHFDCSNYPKDHKLYELTKTNSMIVGKMKDELKRQMMNLYIGLRSKNYYHNFFDKSGKLVETKKGKGTKMCVLKKEIHLKHYKGYNFEGKKEYRVQNLIRSYDHKLFTIEQNKKVMSADDDKRFICSDRIQTLAWGHYRIDEIERTWNQLPLIECY